MVTKTREAKAAHDWIDANGTVVNAVEQATGTRYTSKESGAAVDLQVASLPAQSQLWLACFGMRTLATNEASAARNGQGEGPAEQLAAIAERHALLQKGEMFVDRSREGGGFRVNADALSKALADVQVKTKRIARDGHAAKAAEIFAKIATDDQGVSTLAGKPLKFWLDAPGVHDAYNVHMGKDVASLDDLGAL